LASSVSGIFSAFNLLDDKQQSPQGGSGPQSAPLSTTQQMQQLEVQGQSAGDISASLGLPLAQVESDLDITAAKTAALPTAGTISIKV
jgi:hypothetical protein